MAIIYLLTNELTKKQYVGYTDDFNRRMKWYKNSSNSKSSVKTKLISSIRKYGWENFTSKIIYENEDKKYTLNVMEPLFIDQYDTFNSGYNLTRGGEGCVGFVLSEEKRNEKSQAMQGENNPMHSSKNRTPSMQGKRHTKETIENMKMNRRGLTAGEKNPMFGRGEVISGNKNGRSKDITIFDKTYECIDDCIRETKISRYFLRKYLRGEVNQDFLKSKIAIGG